MSIFALNDNLEKVKVVRLTKKLSCAGNDITQFTWTREELTAAGVGLALNRYAIIGFDFGYTDYPEQWYSYMMDILDSSGSLSVYPRPYIDTWTGQVVVSFYNSDSSAQAVTVRVTLLQVAE